MDFVFSTRPIHSRPWICISRKLINYTMINSAQCDENRTRHRQTTVMQTTLQLYISVDCHSFDYVDIINIALTLFTAIIKCYPASRLASDVVNCRSLRWRTSQIYSLLHKDWFMSCLVAWLLGWCIQFSSREIFIIFLPEFLSEY